MRIIGINFYATDAAVALVEDGRILLALQEERFSRIKSDGAFPALALQKCLRSIELDSIDAFVVATTKALQVVALEKLAEFGVCDLNKIYFPALEKIALAATFYASPFAEATIIYNGAITAEIPDLIGSGNQNIINTCQQTPFPNSLGLLYAAFTYYAGFNVVSGQYKVMGLAPYGKPLYVDKIYDNLLAYAPDNFLYLNPDFFDFNDLKCPITDKFTNLFGCPTRTPESEISQFTADIARSVQSVIEKELVAKAKRAVQITNLPNLCLGGGLALNCVANSKILANFKNVWVQPAANFAGNAVGAALYGWFNIKAQPRLEANDLMCPALLGNAFSNTEIKAFLDAREINYIKLNACDRASVIAKLVADNQVVGLFQGRMEFGPRALGNRSIIANPQNPEMLTTLNAKIKRRESFRPFAPACLAEALDKYFGNGVQSPYMLFVDKIRPELRTSIVANDSFITNIKAVRSSVPAITHVDYSARVQAVSANDNLAFYQIIQQFAKLTGCEMIINTSFNVRGEPIVASPAEAYACFCATEMDCLVLGDFLCLKA